MGFDLDRVASVLTGRHASPGPFVFGHPLSHTQPSSGVRPVFAAYIYRRFCPPGGVVLDTSTGGGGHIVGALASTVVRHYIGIVPDALTAAANRRLLAVLGFDKFATLIHARAEAVDPATLRERCDFAFTSPYFCKEHGDGDRQPLNLYPDAEEWHERSLVPTIALTASSLKPGATCAINLDDATAENVGHPISEWAIAAAKRAGLDHTATLAPPMARRFGSNQGVATEPVYIFRKPCST